MKKYFQLGTAVLLSLFIVLIVAVINDGNRQQTVFDTGGSDSGGKEPMNYFLSEEAGTDDADRFAERRRHLDAVCDKYNDVYRPEYYDLYQPDIHVTNLSMKYFIAAEREFSGRNEWKKLLLFFTIYTTVYPFRLHELISVDQETGFVNKGVFQLLTCKQVHSC
jgi:hypothetical protein